MKPKIGQEIYIVERDSEINPQNSYKGPAVVTKVGRLYFYVAHCGVEIQFSIKTWIQNTCYEADWKAYESKEVYEVEQYNKALKTQIWELVTRYSFQASIWPTESLEKIRELLKGSKNGS